jgi:hypothetical protein
LEESDPNQLRDVEIKRLTELAALAYRNVMDPELKMKTRENWYHKYTNAVLALNQLLKDLQYKDYEERLRMLEKSGVRLRRTVLVPAEFMPEGKS